MTPMLQGNGPSSYRSGCGRYFWNHRRTEADTANIFWKEAIAIDFSRSMNPLDFIAGSQEIPA
jgi:hypothetical protein